MKGQGRYVWPDGSVYDGAWDESERHGKGTMKFNSKANHGETYDGFWYMGQRSGLGKTIFPNGKIHEGEYKDDNQNGQGTIKWADGIVIITTYTNMLSLLTLIIIFTTRCNLCW